MVDKAILDNWKALNTRIKTISEEECEQLLTLERQGEARPQFILRIYGRYNTLRTLRERKELMSE